MDIKGSKTITEIPIKPRKAYLSIDLDYWHMLKTTKLANKFFDKVFLLDLPIFVVRDHHQLLKHINDSGTNMIYNVDYHSDIAGDIDAKGLKWFLSNHKPDCGTWGMYIQWRQDGCFWWMHRIKGDGYCWECKESNPIGYGYTDWDKVKESIGWNKIDWKSITTVGVALSPGYTTEPSVKDVMKKLRLQNSKVDMYDYGYSKMWEPTKF